MRGNPFRWIGPNPWWLTAGTAGAGRQGATADAQAGESGFANKDDILSRTIELIVQHAGDCNFYGCHRFFLFWVFRGNASSPLFTGMASRHKQKFRQNQVQPELWVEDWPKVPVTKSWPPGPIIPPAIP